MNLLQIFKRKQKKITDRYILSIDGGGMRGIIPTQILKQFYSLISSKEEGETYPLTSYFDLIAGTSTGGLIATALTCGQNIDHCSTDHGLQVDLDSLINIYKKDGNTIFPQEFFLTFRNALTDKYPVAPIESLLKTWFSDFNFNQAIIPTIIMAYNASLGEPFQMKSTETTDLKAWEVARCTSAAPTYFSPYKLDQGLIIDGGVVANNPSLYAYTYAKKLYPECEHFHILSLSTCAIPYRFKKKNSYGLSSWLNVHELYSSSQMQTVNDITQGLSDCSYLRIDKPLEEKVAMDNSSKENLVKLENHGKQLFESYQTELSDYASKLIINRKTKKLNASKTTRFRRQNATALQRVR